jgi:YVTN family beta-propeller protein
MRRALIALAAACLSSAAWAVEATSYEIYVTNEGSGDLSLIDASTLTVEATVPIGKRPRGIEATPDGRFLFVALSDPRPTAASDSSMLRAANS